MVQVASRVATLLASLPLRSAAVAVVIAATVLALRRISGRTVGDRLRNRLFVGVPWGTLLTMAGVLAVYLFLQGTWRSPRPLVTPFRTWSYAYPLGMVTGAFSHNGEGHLVGNLLGTLVYGTVVEYAWSHFTEEKGLQVFLSLRSNPLVRILVLPAAAILVGLFTALFAVGPVVGFSGVVFALAGFAVVVRPWLFLGAFVSRRVIDLALTAMRFPELTARGRQQFVTPWWANVAIQGHAIGFLLGVVLGIALLRARDGEPKLERVFFATLVFAVSQGLWAIYLPEGGGRFTLFRWVGTALVFLLALLVATALSDSDQSLAFGFERPSASLAALVLVVALGALAVAAVPSNAVTIDQTDVPENGITVRDYVVTYDEQVENAYLAGIWTPVWADQTRVNESGVIVASDAREVWIVGVQKGQLALNGRARVLLGGVGWRETVIANRTSWGVLGNATVYTVSMRQQGHPSKRVYASPPSTVDATVAGRNITLEPDETGFRVRVTRGNETLARGPIPENRSARRIGGLRFERNRSRLYAERNDTRVEIAVRRQNRRNG